MNIELFSRSKYKNSGRPGDDVALIIPDKVYAVFDGATDPTGKSYGGLGGGRIAARAAARAVTLMAMDGQLGDGAASDIFQTISQAVREEALRHEAAHPPSTTAAIVHVTDSKYRLLLAGDTGIRLNGQTVHQHHKLIDYVSNSARISVFNLLSSRTECPDEAEMQTRSAIFGGLDASVARGLLTPAQAGEIASRAARAVGHPDSPDIRRFLAGGIRSQPGFANAAGSLLGFASLNGDTVIADGTVDIVLDKSAVQSIEIFSDGYLTQPKGANVEAWEAEFERVEAADFHKIERHPAVKGSTSAEFCDDRTVLIVRD